MSRGLIRKGKKGKRGKGETGKDLLSFLVPKLRLGT